ncbi:membrane carboxypeptidase (penicillin-binding protein) [Marinitoga piezophila KA3]|uniref:peptidoglycan glycosyltransferase n=1 Tax=Marinitoga piezophila (strain DSM 14283 / JCM 11233 / KA3) TaxID=443254 RepID=H2J502_MARPK|nr:MULTISPECIES: transglycosylase domain-containing protein [Marinitoga]AEX86019.1 membrane carboxypeptidase (penicillin-binding protein) [Marinitoga piezophila KA3]
MKYFFSGVIVSLLISIILLGYSYSIYKSRSIFSINNNYNTYLFSDGNEIFPPKFKYIEFKDIPVDLTFILLWSEDRDFYGHPGFNLKGFTRAIITNILHGTSYGGSTLTQQIVKNIYLTRKKVITRKIIEIFISFWVERNYTKNDILEAYINTAYLGNDINGFGAAAKRYYNKELKDLNMAEISVLVGILNAPEYYNPYKHPLKAKKQGLIILDSLFTNNFLSKEEYKNYTQLLNEMTFKKPDFDDNNLQLVLAIKEEADRLGIKNGGYIIKSTINRDLFETVKDTWDASKNAILLNNKTGEIISFFGSQYDVFKSKRQIGSNIKPFYYLLAIEKGFSPETQLIDEPLKIGNWAPKNFEKTFRGSVSLKEALIHSINIPSIQLFLKLGNSPTESIKIVENFLKNEIGMDAYYPDDITISLGTIESNTYNIARAFTIFPNFGLIPKIYIIDEIMDKNGNVIYKRQPKIERKIKTISNTSYNTMNKLLKEVVEEGTARNLFASKRDFYGKTGTADNSVWFSGFDGKITISTRVDGKFLLSTTHAIPAARKILGNYYSYNSFAHVPYYYLELSNKQNDSLTTFLSTKFNISELRYSKSGYIKNIQNYEFLFPDYYYKSNKLLNKDSNPHIFEYENIPNQTQIDKDSTDILFMDTEFPDLYFKIRR